MRIWFCGHRLVGRWMTPEEERCSFMAVEKQRGVRGRVIGKITLSKAHASGPLPPALLTSLSLQTV